MTANIILAKSAVEDLQSVLGQIAENVPRSGRLMSFFDEAITRLAESLFATKTMA
jgi:hypothetical protein